MCQRSLNVVRAFFKGGFPRHFSLSHIIISSQRIKNKNFKSSSLTIVSNFCLQFEFVENFEEDFLSEIGQLSFLINSVCCSFLQLLIVVKT